MRSLSLLFAASLALWGCEITVGNDGVEDANLGSGWGDASVHTDANAHEGQGDGGGGAVTDAWSPPPPDGACAILCESLVNCAQIPDLCPDLAGQEGLFEGCLRGCGALDAPPEIMASCEGIIGLVSGWDPQVAAACAPPIPMDTCTALCGELRVCAADPALCPGFEGAQRDDVEAGCLASCRMAGVRDGTPYPHECGALVGFVAGFNAEFDALCGSEAPPPPPPERCLEMCDGLSVCLSDPDLCPGLGGEIPEEVWHGCLMQCELLGPLPPLPPSCREALPLAFSFNPDLERLCAEGPPPPPPVDEPCQQLCDRLTLCAADAALCPGLGGEHHPDVRAACEIQCAASGVPLSAPPDFIACDALVAITSDFNPEFAQICYGGVEPPPEDDCPRACDYLVMCAMEGVEACRVAGPAPLFEACVEVCQPNEGLIMPIFEQECGVLLDLAPQVGFDPEAICQEIAPVEVPEICVTACDTVTACAMDSNQCEMPNPHRFFEICVDLCAQEPGMADLAVNSECRMIMDILPVWSPALNDACLGVAPPPEEGCPMACDYMTHCALESGRCQADPQRVFDLCIDVCFEGGGQDIEQLLQTECAALVEMFIEVNPEMAEICDAPPPVEPIGSCEHACELSLGCAFEVCPDAAQTRPERLFAHCLEACQPMEPMIVGQTPSGCGQMVDLLRMIDGEFAAACQPEAPPTQSCEVVCAGAIDCAYDPRLCPGFEGVNLGPFFDNCMLRCEGQERLLAGIDINDCPSLIELASAVDPVFGEICGYTPEAPPPPDPEACLASCDYIVMCSAEVCAQEEPGAFEEIQQLCVEACASGDGVMLPLEPDPARCPELVELLRSFSPDYAQLCPPR
ncbi:hypothetical protein KKB55_09200 [Myxococcota bacterium]|nr:hypothetical protein [Myxococcota bacterium]MBU1897911.1 hypothetical protein [Myxococcota bacterium]